MKQILKFTAVLLGVLAVFSSCSGKKDVALNIGSGQVSSDVYSYFLDYVIITESKDKKMSDNDIKKRASELCLEYVKINTKFDDMNLSLDAGKKAKIADDVTNKWSFFGKYYKSIGVSKQTLTKIEENQAFREAILLATYDTSGTNPVSEDEIKAYFSDNYVFFKSINGYLKVTDEKGQEVKKTPQEIEEIVKNFTSMAKSITEENTIDNVNSAYLQEGENKTTLPVAVTTKDSKDYPKGFFEKVLEIKVGSVGTLIFDDYIFVVQRFNNFDEAQEFYENYRTTCLKEMVKNDFSKDIKSWYKDSKLSENSRVQDKCYKTIVEVRNENKS